MKIGSLAKSLLSSTKSTGKTSSASSAYSPQAFGNAFLGSNYSVSSSSSSNPISSSKGTSSSGSGSFQKTGDPDKDAQNYANQKGISLEQAKKELKQMYGDPQKPQQDGQGGA